jgi:hypothetical protein
MKTWNDSWDLSSIPEALFASEIGRRNNAKVVNRRGGVVWGKHRPKYSRCRCERCIGKREAQKQKPQPPKRPRGRPPKVERMTVAESRQAALDNN